MSERFAFTIDATDGAARTGSIAMRRGTIRTPAFMPVGTAATVKAMKQESKLHNNRKLTTKERARKPKHK